MDLAGLLLDVQEEQLLVSAYTWEAARLLLPNLSGLATTAAGMIQESKA